METGAILAFTLLQTLIVGLLLLILPRIGRRGLLFGVYVGESRSEGEEAGRIRRGWYRGMAVLLAAATALGIALHLVSGSPLAGQASTVLLSAGFFALYFRAHGQARRLADDTIRPDAAAPLEVGPSRANLMTIFAIVVGLAGGLLAIGYVWSRYPLLPERVPIHFGFDGVPDGWAKRSFWSVMLPPIMTFVMGVGLGGGAYLVAHAKRALRHPDGGCSLGAQDRFRAALSRVLATVAVLVTLFLGTLSIASVRVALGEAGRLSPAIDALGVALFVYTIAGILYVALRYGQGGARLERGAATAPLTDGLADNRFWRLGMIYINRDDPSFLVEHRFGLGYTINFGNWKAVALLVALLLASIGLSLVTVWGVRG